MEALPYTDDYLRGILERTRVIAMVGASTHWNRPSYFAFKYLREKGYRVIPVNPRASGDRLLGEPIAGTLGEISDVVDLVDIFRPSAEAGAITDEAIRIGARTVWMQLGVRDDDAALRATAAGLDVVMNRCPKIEYGRLFRELGWGGINSNVISSRRPSIRKRVPIA